MSAGEAPEAAPSEARIRLFVALELPSSVRAVLAEWRGQVAPPGLRLIAPEALHVTLCFLGWQASDDVEAIAAACRIVAGEPGPALALTGAVWLPRRRPRVLAVELDDADGRLARIQAALSEALTAGGWYEAEHRRYLPHVIVARVPGRAGLGRKPPELAAPTRIDFRAARVVLYRSRLSSGGARYEALAAVELAG